MRARQWSGPNHQRETHNTKRRGRRILIKSNGNFDVRKDKVSAFSPSLCFLPHSLSPLRFASLPFSHTEARPKPNPVAPTQPTAEQKRFFFTGPSSSSARRVASNLAGAAGDGSVPVAARGLPRTRAPTPTGGAARFSAGLSSGSPDRRRAGAACWWRLAGFVAVSARVWVFSFLFLLFPAAGCLRPPVSIATNRRVTIQRERSSRYN
jgi:hypothetical protein